MKKFFWIVVLYILFCHLSVAGNDAKRYRDVVFQEVKIDSVAYCKYGSKELLMDVYQPIGDTALQRPLVILAHGGAFMAGNRHAERIPAICRELTMRGFVVASIDYRLTNLLGMASRRSAYKAIIKATADGRNSVRWFINNAAKKNTYHIDPKKIFFGGSSAGGILAEQLAFIDSANGCKQPLCKVVNKFLPDSDALPPHSIHGFLSLAGGVLDTNLITSGHPALFHIQGDADHVVPYGYKHPIGGIAPFKLAGLGASRQRYISQKLNYTEYVLNKSGHTPWDYDQKALKILLEQMIAFLNKELK